MAIIWSARIPINLVRIDTFIDYSFTTASPEAIFPALCLREQKHHNEAYRGHCFGRNRSRDPACVSSNREKRIRRVKATDGAVNSETVAYSSNIAGDLEQGNPSNNTPRRIARYQLSKQAALLGDAIRTQDDNDPAFRLTFVNGPPLDRLIRMVPEFRLETARISRCNVRVPISLS